MNRLIACGGTGAHVVLAMMRLHMLGYPLGFFRNKATDKPVEFPDLYLVDQDSGDGINELTAWQAVRGLIDRHPGRYNVGALGRESVLESKSVTPLPVGERKQWPAPPHNTLGAKFSNSSILSLIASQRQRGIDYSLGMMASPAVGSLLFKLKEYDNNPVGVNYDRDYSAMCTFNPDERVVVIGSSVGGTGSSVAPTLAEKCAKDGAKVMAVMIQQWFKFPLEGKHYEAAYLRNKDMEENEASGLASYGERLMENAAAVLVGVPEKALCNRDYEGDNQQPIQHSYAHDVAALAAMQHFTARDPFEKGVYGLSASDKARLTDDISIGGDTLRDLVDKACVFEYMLEVLIKALKDTKSSSRRLAPRLLLAVKKLGNSPQEVAKHLDAFRKDYAESLDWLKSLGIDVISPNTQQFSKRFYYEARVAQRLESNRLSRAGQGLTSERVAAEIFHWAAQWIQDAWSEGLVSHSAPKDALPVTGYWPDAADAATGLTPQFSQPGELASVRKQDVLPTLNMLYDQAKVSQNGWPHPISVVEQFRFSIKNQTESALRQLEILLTGLAAGKFMLEKVEERDDAGPSISRLLKDLRENGFYGLASHRIVRKKDDKVLGFNSPWTLFCPIPGLTEEDWQELWCDLTGSSDGKEWKTSQVWRRQARARGSVGGWLKGLSEHISHDLPPWATALQSRHSDSYAFSVGEWVSVYWGAQQDERSKPIAIPIPSAEIYGQASWDEMESVDSAEFLRDVPEFERIGEFFLCRDFHIPGSEEFLWAIWKEHLDLLQEEGHIFAWRHKKGVDQLEILWDFGRRVLLKGMRVISEGLIRIPTCIPLAQDHVPGSARRARTKYPDLPLRPEYIGLAKTDQGEDLVELLVEGVSDTNRLSVGKAQPGPDSVTWELKLKGRDNPLRITIAVDQPQGDERVRAHWMVWPGFRASKGGDPWRAYYMYAQATRPSLGVQALYVDDSDRLSKAKKKNPQGEFAGSALSFDPDPDQRRHVGGPPAALCSYDDAMKCDTGMYLVPLQALERVESSWKLAIDFGTSHTVAATQGVDKTESINLDSELTSHSRNDLSLHISENWPGVSEWDRALWRPTYITEEDKVRDTKALIPSDIYSIKKLNQLNAQHIRGWEPVSDCVIPAMELLRPDLPEHILSDFKWKITHPKFAESEASLREIYLGMALEIFVADMVRMRHSLPQKIDATFTYPLRTALNSEAKRFGESLKNKILKRSSQDLGCAIKLVNGEGLYSESHAARGGAKRAGEIIIVGDLGGGTLDMHISATDRQEDGRFSEVADSVKLGGNLLLDLMAADASRYLPEDGGWSPDDPPAAAAKLRAYMRARGSVNLFGTQSAGDRDDALGLSGFEKAANGNAARMLIDKYFWLISDYMARSLVAYIGTEWWHKAGADDRDRLQIIVQLRGNGWRLWYDSNKYPDIQKKMQRQILELALKHWEAVGMQPPVDDKWGVSGADDNPKLAPICNVVGESLGPDDAAQNSFKFPLSNLELLFHDAGEPTRQVNWFDRLPFENAKDAMPQIGHIDPPVVLEDPGDPASRTVRTLGNELVTAIHKAIRKDDRVLKGTTYNAPIASWIWEKIFDSELTKGS